jgi:hypothetical protein
MIEETMGTLCITECLARALLIKFFWDKDRLIDKYFSTPDLAMQLFNYDPN